MDSFEVKLTRIRPLSSTTKDFRFEPIDDRTIEFLPGQFYRFVFTDEQGEFERSYSLCNFEDEQLRERVLDLVISTVKGGRASGLLFAAEPGLRARVTGPFGRLLVPSTLPRRLFLVATSVGIAPFMPMLAQLAEPLQNNEVEVHFLYGTRDRSELVYGESLKAFTAAHSGFHLSACYSRQNTGAPLDNEIEFSGYVQDRLMSLKPDPATDHILLCGNPKMIDETYANLKALGFGVKQVVREKYVFAKDKQQASTGKPAMTDAQKKLIAEKMKKYQ